MFYTRQYGDDVKYGFSFYRYLDKACKAIGILFCIPIRWHSKKDYFDFREDTFYLGPGVSVITLTIGIERMGPGKGLFRDKIRFRQPFR